MKHRLLLGLALAGSTLWAEAATTNIAVVYPPGYRMVSNPLLSTNNDVSNIFKDPPPSLTLFKFSAGGYTISTYDPDLLAWTAPMTLVPGEGAFLYNPGPGNYTNNFTGEAQFCATNNIPPGISIKSQIPPLPGLITYPVSPGDTLFFWNGGGYNFCVYDPDVPGWTCGQPTARVGEAFWVFNFGPAKSWVTCLSGP